MSRIELTPFVRGCFVLFIYIIASLLVSCKEDGMVDTGCPEPIIINSNVRIPQVFADNKALSFNEDRLAFTKRGTVLCIQDLASGKYVERDLYLRVVGVGSITYVSKVLWCPYDDNRLLLQIMALEYDSVKRVNRGPARLCMYFLEQDSLVNIPLTILNDSRVSSVKVRRWLPTSTSDRDALWITYWDGNTGVRSGQSKYYDIKQGTYSEAWSLRYVMECGDMYEGNILSMVQNNQSGGLEVYYNGRKVDMPPFDEIQSIQYNRSATAVAMVVVRKLDTVPERLSWPEVWWIPVDKIVGLKVESSDVVVVDLKQRYCMYAFCGIDLLCYGSNRMLLNMHKDGDRTCDVYNVEVFGSAYQPVVAF